MAYETKVILKFVANTIGNADTLEEAYEAIVEAASIEGLSLPSYAEHKEKQSKKRDK